MRPLLFFFCFIFTTAFTEPCHIILIRHGQTDALVNNTYCNDSSLTPKGQAQAQSVVDSLREIAIDAIYSSPLRRAVQTSAPLTQQRSLPATTDDALKERSHGSLEGHLISEYSGNPLFRRYYHPANAEDLRIKLVPDAESFEESTHRFIECLKKIAAAHPNQTVAIFSHSGLMTGLMISITHRFDQPSIPNGGIIHITIDQDLMLIDEQT